MKPQISLLKILSTCEHTQKTYSQLKQYHQETSIMRHILGLAYGVLFVEINCLRKIKEERKRSITQIKNTRIYVIRQYVCIHGWRQGESFTKKQVDYNNGTRTLLKKTQTPNTLQLSLTPRINQENKTFSNYSSMRHCSHTLLQTNSLNIYSSQSRLVVFYKSG